MNRINYKLFNESLGTSKVIYSDGVFSFFYPCISKTKCTEYELSFSPGIYKIDLYGASGGYIDDKISLIRNQNSDGCVLQAISGNTACRNYGSMSGTGGYSSGKIRIFETTKAFLSIGGCGTIGYNIPQQNTDECYFKENMVAGGYNGGGSASNFYESPSNYGSSGGGGGTDLRIEENDLFHRVIVAGGGGGSDNPGGTPGGTNDGSGGAGGGEISQGFRINGMLNNDKLARQTSGFSFGFGEAARNSGSNHPNGISTPGGSSDRGGGGGGWFGGFSAHNGNGGGSGGSSFILSKNSTIPDGPITIFDEYYTPISTGFYAFSPTSVYSFQFPSMSSGVWEGNGFAQIICISSETCSFAHRNLHIQLSLLFLFSLILLFLS